MKIDSYNLIRLDAEDGKVFDWADLSEHISIDEEGNQVQEHLYAKTIFLGLNDNVSNYVEVDIPTE